MLEHRWNLMWNNDMLFFVFVSNNKSIDVRHVMQNEVDRCKMTDQ